jgi:hypothetical protein
MSTTAISAATNIQIPLGANIIITAQVTPPPQPVPPTVNAGPDQAITLPTNTVKLQGIVTYSDAPGPQQSIAWTQTGGPTGVVFSPATSVNSVAMFPGAGVYTLRLTATDGPLVAYDEMLVTVNSAIIITPPPAGGGKAYHVTNTAQFLSVCRTQANPGDSVYCAAGNYAPDANGLRGDPGNSFGHVFGGDPNNPVYILPEPGQIPIFTTELALYSVIGATLRGLHFGSGGSIYATIQNWVQPYGARCSKLVFDSNVFSGPQQRYGFLLISGDFLTAIANTITCTGQGGSTDHGIYCSGGTGNQILNNIVSGTSGYGIHNYDEDGINIDHPLVQGNTVFGSRLRSGMIVSCGGSSKVLGAQFIKNIIYGNAQAAFDLSSYGAAMAGIALQNNTTYENTLAGITGNQNLVGGASGMKNIFYEKTLIDPAAGLGAGDIILTDNVEWPSPVVYGNITHSGDIVVDPEFVNAASGNFALKPGSPATGYGAL